MKPNFKSVANILAKMFLIPVIALCVACENGPEETPGNGGTDEPAGDGSYEDIKVVDGKVQIGRAHV